jgi:HSP20 family protein
MSPSVGQEPRAGAGQFVAEADKSKEVPMSDITFKRVSKVEDHSLPVFTEFERLTRDIEKRAHDLFELRGFGEGHALDDWLRAEHEICWPAAELVERDKEFMLSVALPGYEPSEIELTVTPREVIVHAARRAEKVEEGKETEGRMRWSEFRSNDVYRRIELPTAIDADHAKAAYRHGMLKVTAPKAEAVVKQVPVAAAA